MNTAPARRPVLVIVTPWYPSRFEPVVGIFVAKQAEAFRREMDVRVIHTQFSCELPRQMFTDWLLRRKRPQPAITEKPDMTLYMPFRWVARLAGRRLALRWLAWRVRRALQKCGRRVDSVLAWISWPSGCAASDASRALGVPCAVLECTSAFESYVEIPAVRERLAALYRGPDAMLTVSPLMTRRIEKALGFSFPALETGCVIADEFFALPLERSRSEKVRIICVGAVCYDKGQHHLIAAAAKLKAAGREEFEITCAGFGPELELFRRQAVTAGVDHLVKFPGGVSEEEKLRLYGTADFFVTPTLHDTFGAVVAEAMAAGLPVVSTENGASEWIVDANTGIVCGTDDAGSLAEALAKMITACQTYDRAAIRERVRSLFSTPAYNRRLRAALKLEAAAA